jgi:hypothetical protein
MPKPTGSETVCPAITARLSSCWAEMSSTPSSQDSLLSPVSKPGTSTLRTNSSSSSYRS